MTSEASPPVIDPVLSENIIDSHPAPDSSSEKVETLQKLSPQSASFLTSFWKFTRPHTIYGTTASVLSLYLLALPFGILWIEHWLSLAIALLACLGMNIYIVGLNQLTDIEIDRINKPHLPLAAGSLTPHQGWRIILFCGILALFASSWQRPYLLATVVSSGLIGTAYSLPPLRLKRFPLAAAACIYLVRGLIVNLGLYQAFRQIAQLPIGIPPQLIALTLFMSIFGVAIAIFKDIPDMEGDRQFQIATFSLRWGQAKVLNASVAILSLAYAGMILFSFFGFLPIQKGCLSLICFLSEGGIWFLILHGLGLVVLLAMRLTVQIECRQTIVNYYQLIWKLFYLEYLFYPLTMISMIS
ncbi:MAG: homogentisate phytyltransferase [Cyanobacteriota bacterium]|nr:homogentisate phytyltransferase [Cyanobacteriota bacterium]